MTMWCAAVNELGVRAVLPTTEVANSEVTLPDFGFDPIATGFFPTRQEAAVGPLKVRRPGWEREVDPLYARAIRAQLDRR